MSKEFNGRKAGNERWSVKEERRLNPKALNMIVSAKVVLDFNFYEEAADTAEDYGLSCCFTMKSGDTVHIQMSLGSKVDVGDILDLKRIHVLRLKDSDVDGSDIYRISY